MHLAIGLGLMETIGEVFIAEEDIIGSQEVFGSNPIAARSMTLHTETLSSIKHPCQSLSIAGLKIILDSILHCIALHGTVDSTEDAAMATWFDRMTVNWAGEEEIKVAQEFRRTVGERNINKTIKELIRMFLMGAKQQDKG